MTHLERYNRILDRLRANGHLAVVNDLRGFLERLDAAEAVAKTCTDQMENLQVQLRLCQEDRDRAQDVIRIAIAPPVPASKSWPSRHGKRRI